MVEIALCLAIVGFALVAIIGVLPAGLNVQKDNREETVINQDAGVWLDALRAGGTNQFGVFDELTNYVDRIVVERYQYNPPNLPYRAPEGRGTVFKQDGPFRSGSEIVGLLSTPQITTGSASGSYFSNYVYAYVRAMNGVAADLPPQDNVEIQDQAFSYKLVVQTTPLGSHDVQYANMLTNQTDLALRDNLADIRLLFRWPLKQSVKTIQSPGADIAVGNARMVYRTQFSGRIQFVADPNADLYFLQPRDYQK